MSFTRVNPVGWAYLEVLTSGQMNELDTNVSNAVDGRGGTYNNADPLLFLGEVSFYNFQGQCSYLSRPNGATAFPIFDRLSNAPHSFDGRPPFRVLMADLVTTGHYWTITRDGAVAGNMVLISRGNNSGAFGLPIMNDDPSPGLITTIGATSYALLVFNGTDWEKVIPF
jgi:hypothetical protein